MVAKKRKKGRIGRVLIIAVPLVMVGLGVLTVAVGGWKALMAVIPILAVHVAVALVVIPLWARYRRRRSEAEEEEEGDGD